MSYKEKYLKYKNKYFELKQKAGMISKLDKDTTGQIKEFLTCHEAITNFFTLKKIDPSLIVEVHSLPLISTIFDEQINLGAVTAPLTMPFPLTMTDIELIKYYNKCFLITLYKRYINNRIPNRFTIEDINFILLCLVVASNSEDPNYYEETFNKLIQLGGNLVEIPERWFNNQNIVYISIPNTVQTIGESAFEDNQIRDLIIPNSVHTIGRYAFRNNKIQYLIISNSVQTISASAFRDNKIQYFEIPDSVHTIGAYAFYDNEIVTFTIPGSVQIIGNYAFAKNRIQNLIIPDSVHTIGIGAFSDNHIQTLTIPIRFQQHIQRLFNFIEPEITYT